MLKKLAERFFRWYCHPDFYEDIKGDLDELYLREDAQAHRLGPDAWLMIEVIKLFRPALMRRFILFPYSNHLDMFINYLKIGFRNLMKHKAYSAIHIFGLALGLASFLLINEYTSFEKSYDRHYADSDQLYRLTTDNIINGKLTVRDAMSFAPSGKMLMDELPEVLSYTVTHKRGSTVFKKETNLVDEKMVLAADSNFLRLFNYPILAGNKDQLLVEPYTLVLTESKARKYFGSADPIGKSIEVLGSFNRPFKVVGVVADVPENTHYKFDILMSLKSIQDRIERDNWNGFNYYTYLKLTPGADVAAMQPKLEPLAKQYIGEESNLYFNIQPIEDIHLYSDFTYEPEIHGSAKAVNFLSIISLFILLIAWVNYVNLSTAKAVERAQEVGLRKVVGARKQQLIGQFLVESLLINFFGALAALMLAQVLLPQFNFLVGKTVLTSVLTNTAFLQKLALFFLLGTLISGFYPAFVLSSFKPIGVLKGSFSRSKHGTLLRQVLVVVQFAASLILIANTIIVYRQGQYMTGRDKGIDIEQVIGLENPSFQRDQVDQFRSKYKAFNEELDRLSGVEKVGGIMNLPGGGSSDISSNAGGVRIVGVTDIIDGTVYINAVDEDLQEALGVSLVAGRNFIEEMASDSNAVIVNETFLKYLNINDFESVIEEKVQFGRDPENDMFRIVGVFKDYNRTTLKNSVEPTLFYRSRIPGNMVVRLQGDDPKAAIQTIENKWAEFFPDSPFAYSFLDNRFEKLYVEDKKFGMLFGNFSILAIIVASLGLLGLASFLAIQRTKEVGVRKVLGATTGSIILLFFKDFIYLLLVAMVIGLPLIYVSMNGWLSNYAYRIDFPWWAMIVACLVIGLFAFATVGFQTYRVAILNPAKTIRYE